MTLIILLCSLGLEYFLGVLDKVRQLNWFNRYSDWLENRFVQSDVWNSAVGIVMTLAGPLLVILLIDYGLQELFYPLTYLFALAILLNSVGPTFLNESLTEYADALDNDDDVQSRHYATELCHTMASPDPVNDEQDIVESILVQANERLFAVIFWFIVLGPLGAALYRFAHILKKRNEDIHGAYADSARHLNNILNWPSARLFSLGNALSGNMIESIEAWKECEEASFNHNEAVIISSGLGALQYRKDDSDDEAEDKSYWISAAQGLINRTLIVWLTVLGMMTIAGVLA